MKMKDLISSSSTIVTIICGLIVIYLGLTDNHINYISILIVTGGISLTLMGIMHIRASIILNKKLKEEGNES